MPHPLHMPVESTLWHGLRALLHHDPLIAASRKISAAGMSDRRLLFTFPRMALLSADDPSVLVRLTGGSLPAMMADHWQRADVVHVGVDASYSGTITRKLYLEFGSKDAPEPDLAYLALKCGGGLQALHRYDRVAQAQPLLAALALPAAFAQPAAWLANLSGDLLRVADPDAARLSLDICLADLAAYGDVLPVVARLVAAVNADTPAPAEIPSHVAVGRDSHGVVFVTLYGWPMEPS